MDISIIYVFENVIILFDPIIQCIDLLPFLRHIQRHESDNNIIASTTDHFLDMINCLFHIVIMVIGLLYSN